LFVKPIWSEKMTVLSTFLESSLNFLSNNLQKHYKLWYSQGEKRCQTSNWEKHSLKKQSETKSPVKPTWREKITVLSTFLKSSLNFLSNNLKIHFKIWYSQEEKRGQNSNCQKHGLKEDSETKSPVNPLGDKVTVISTFLKSSLNFLSNNLQKHYKLWYSQGEKRCQTSNWEKHSLKKQSESKSPVKPTWREKMTVLSTFLKSSLNFLSNNLKKHYKTCYSQQAKRCKSSNCQKHSLTGRSETKSRV